MNRQAFLGGLLAGLLFTAIAAAWIALGGRPIDPETFGKSLAALSDGAPLLFVMLYAMGTVLFLPGAVFTLAAGALFGPIWGALLSLAGATLGATGAFLSARHIASDWVRRRTGPRLERFIRGVEAEGWRFVAFVRLVPLFPFNLTNYALGLTHISLSPYVLASALCMAPGALAYSWLGYAGRSALSGDISAIRYGLAALGLLAAIVFLPRLVRRLRGARPGWIEVDDLADRLMERGTTVIDVRGRDEFSGPLGHISGSINLPLDTLTNCLSEIGTVRHNPVVLVCRTDKRSANAAALLSDAGFRDVQVLRGGLEAWNRVGKPVERNPAPERQPLIGGAA